MSGNIIGSTNIDDLPGSEEYQNYETPAYLDDRTNQIANMNNNGNVNLNRNLDVPRLVNANVTANINNKSKDVSSFKFSSEDSYYDIIMSYFTKENLVLLIILYIACLRQSDEYTRKLLLNVPFNLAHNNVASTIIKCIILLIVYLIVKQYV